MAKVIDMNLVDKAHDDLVDYAIYVNLRRALTDFRDGLKCIHRRIIYGMCFYENAITGTVKCAGIVGSVMKHLHPHGDAAIYDSMKPMANWNECYVPLVLKQGTFGNILGDKAAAPRYTEAMLSPFALECVIGPLRESKNVVDWSKTYLNDPKKLEPNTLPTVVPLLLINGTFGIGYGIKAEVPSHNINEVLDAMEKLMINPEEEVVLIPDQCQKCQIVNTNFKAISNRGQGQFYVRSIIDIEETPSGKYKGYPSLVIKSIPDLTFLRPILESIEKLVADKKLIQIIDTADESRLINEETIYEREELQYRVILKKGSDPSFVRDMLYKKTDLEKKFTINFYMLDGIEPVRMSYKGYLLKIIEQAKLTKFRLYCNRLQQVQTKFHEKDAFIKAMQSGLMDEIDARIKRRTDINDTEDIEYLVSQLNITDMQARYILESHAKERSLGYINKYVHDAERYREATERYMNIITDDKYIENEIIEDLHKYKKKYGKPRNCVVIDEAELNNIPAGEFKIVITERNFIKKVQVNDPVGNYKGDAPKIILKGDNTQNILIFDDQGKVFKLPINNIPFSDRASNGTDIRMIVRNLTANINTVLYEPYLKDLSVKLKKFFVNILTSEGNIKKLDIEDFLSVPPSGIFYIKLDNTDSVKSINIVPDGADIIVYSKDKALRMNLSEVPHQRRNTKGMRAMISDELDGLSVITNNNTDIVVITEGGKVNRFSSLAIPAIGRNKAGVNVIKLSKGDFIKDVHAVKSTNSICIVTSEGKQEILVSDIQEGSSISAGSKLVNTKNNPILKTYVLKKK